MKPRTSSTLLHVDDVSEGAGESGAAGMDERCSKVSGRQFSSAKAAVLPPEGESRLSWSLLLGSQWVMTQTGGLVAGEQARLFSTRWTLEKKAVKVSCQRRRAAVGKREVEGGMLVVNGENSNSQQRRIFCAQVSHTPRGAF